MPERGRNLNEFSINVRARHTECFYAELMELSVSAFLWPLMAEHRALIPEPLLLVIQQTMLVRGTDAARCAFRSEAEIVSVAIVKAVHLFFDNIGYFTD